ncbi:alpha-helical ferredoxin [Desulfoluna butyratoxydans]|uniref:Alpha-helical ferredoxin n=1 Tax=Desulfoluna butyratoxydans TaxID=231438 RepID=A0A4U8YH60_9BACT|nr:alpha-helical ferredoxin [Desulfoluna butyratoxydans]
MTGETILVKTGSLRSFSDPSQSILPRCTGCGKCRVGCAFLKEHGSPLEIRELLETRPEEALRLAFLCSLCGLCTAVCPEGADPAAFFLALRREAAESGKVDLSPYTRLLAYEARGVSRRFTWAHLPEGCDTIFFPGCGLSGTRSHKTFRVWQYIREQVPQAGLVLDCCTKPSHDLGRQGAFENAFGELHRWLLDRGVRRVVVACPNCFKVFHQYGSGLETQSVYELMAGDADLVPTPVSGALRMHDPCAVRFEEGIHGATRELALRSGVSLVESARSGRRTLCCGEGGAVGAVCPGHAEAWRQRIQGDRAGEAVLTYCSGCASRLGGRGGARHLLDLFFNDGNTIPKATGSPLTYLHRLGLKRRVKKISEPAVTRERHVSMGGGSKGAWWVKGLILMALIGMAAALKISGFTDSLAPEAVRQWVEGYGLAAPLIFAALYCIGPCLLLPASPLTLAAGLLFGPVMGLACTMVGATGGATLAFLVSRYLAGDWVRGKVAGTGLERLDRKVAEEGWKVVAFTRLVPVFPFVLLNYAFGLTRVRLSHYVAATVVCMFPATLAFILFSSSLLDLLQGRITAPFVGGFLLLCAVGTIPFIVKRFWKKAP